MSTTTPDSMAVVRHLGGRIAQLEVDNAIYVVTIEQLEAELAEHRADLLTSADGTPVPMPTV